MIRVYKAPIRHSFGWSDPRTYLAAPSQIAPLHRRLVEDTETGYIHEYIHEYIHGAVNANIA